MAIITCAIAFAGIFIWSYSKRQKSFFDEAANLPFADEGHHQPLSDNNKIESNQSHSGDTK